MICPTCSWPMVTQEAKAGFLSSSCLSGKCARVCYIPLKEDDDTNKVTTVLAKKIKVPSLTDVFELGDKPSFHRGGCF